MMMLAHNRAQKQKLRSSTGGEKMKTAKRITNGWMIAVVAMAIVGMTVGAARAGTIYFDDFSGGSGTDLHGTTPDITTGGETWVATSNYKADGSSTAQNQSTMSLAFTPINGLVYTLDGDIETVDGTEWVQFGFGDGQPTSGYWTTRAWHLLRQAGGENSKHYTALNGTGNLAVWSSLETLTYANDIDVRIVLDTTGGTGFWTATFYAKPGNVETYTEVRSATTLDEDITSVGFSTYNSIASVQFISISLSDNLAPADPVVEVSDDTVASNAPPGTLVGVLSDPTDTATHFVLTNGVGNADNAKFQITDGTNLRTTVWMSQYSNSVSIAALSNSTALVTNSLPIYVTAPTYGMFEVAAGMDPSPTSESKVGILSLRPEADNFEIVGGRDDLFTISDTTNLMQVVGTDAEIAEASFHYVQIKATSGALEQHLLIKATVGSARGSIFVIE